MLTKISYRFRWKNETKVSCNLPFEMITVKRMGGREPWVGWVE